MTDNIDTLPELAPRELVEPVRTFDDAQLVEDSYFERNEIGRVVGYSYEVWNDAVTDAVAAVEKMDEGGFELAAVAQAVDVKEGPDGLKKLAADTGISAANLQKTYSNPLEQTKHLNKVTRVTLLSTPTISLKHLRSAAPLAVWSPESYEKVLTEAAENSHSAGWVAREVKPLLKAAKQGALEGDYDTSGQNWNLINSEVAGLSDYVADSTVDVIITDPPYPKEHLDVYGQLGETAARVLKEGGSAFVMVGQSYLPDVLSALCEHLDYHWTLAYLTPGGQSVQLWDRNVNTFWKPILWLTKGKYEGPWLGDVCKSDTNDNDKTHHHWGQSESGMADLVERASLPGQLVLDPFVGGGTTAVVALDLKRRFVGADVDENALATTGRRIKKMAS